MSLRKKWILFGVMAGVSVESLMMGLLLYFQWRNWQPRTLFSHNPYEWGLAGSIIVAVITLIIAVFLLISALKMRKNRAEYLEQHPEPQMPVQPIEERAPKLFAQDNSELIARYIHTKRRQALCVAIIAGVVEVVIVVLLNVGDVMEYLYGATLTKPSLLPVVSALQLIVEAPLCLVARYLGRDANWKWLTVIATVEGILSLITGLSFGLTALI